MSQSHSAHPTLLADITPSSLLNATQTAIAQSPLNIPLQLVPETTLRQTPSQHISSNLGSRNSIHRRSLSPSSGDSHHHSRCPSVCRCSRFSQKRSSNRSRHRSRSSRWRSPSTSEQSDAPESCRSRRSGASRRRRTRSPSQSARRRASSTPIGTSGSVSEMEVQQHSTGLGSAESSKVTSHGQDITTTGVGVPPSPGDSRSARNSGLQSLPSQRRTNGPTVSSLPLGHSGQSLMPLIRASVTPATWQVYGKAWEEWCSLVKGRPVDTCVRARCDVVVELLNLLKSRGASGTLAQRNLTGVAFFFQLMGWADVTKYFFIKQAVKGWRRLQPSQECRRPISLSLLHDIITKSETVCKSQYESALISTAFAIAFFGALRISELVPHSKTALIGGLINEDLVICSDALRIRVRKSKCDPTGRGSWVLVKALEGPICPVKIVRHYAVIRHESRFFLSHTDGSPLTKYQFHTIFKKCLQAVGVDPKEYGTHSFRIGAATEAARAGAAEAEVQRLGRWKSACFARYIRPDLL
ncbi:uncharacterized protein [Dendrobates tinctorius]|uniref:uncharacterized protein isoform X4 n=2 Tax=Dendrobates tinctorius TaxID=92724 RepID=UPI003CC99778